MSSIDLELGTRLAGNKPDLARDLLHILAKNLSSDVRNIKQSHLSDNTQELKSLVHKLHGATSYCGVPRLTSILAELTAAIKKQETDQVTHLITELESEAAQVLKEISELGN